MAREATEIKLHESLESLQSEKCPDRREPKVIVSKDGSKRWAYVRSAEHARSEYARQVCGVEVYPVEPPAKAADLKDKIAQLSPEEMVNLKAMLTAG